MVQVRLIKNTYHQLVKPLNIDKMVFEKSYLEKLPLLGVVFLLCFFSLGFHFGWLLQPYDELRLQQIVFTLCLFFILFYRKIFFSAYLGYQFLFLFIFLFLHLYFYATNIYVFQDLLILILAPIWIFSISISCKSFAKVNIDFLYKILFFIVIISVLPTIFIFLSIKNFLIEGNWYNWHMNYDSIRVYNSFIVPVFFITLYLRLVEFKYIKRIYLILVFLISLSLWFDGARSAILSILIGLIFIFFYKKKFRKKIFITGILILVAFLSYYLTYYIHNQLYEIDQSLNIVRSSSSGRLRLWRYIYEHWILQPFQGLGGGYLATTDYPLNHLHNLYLRLIFEWGALGLMYLIWIVYQVLKIIKSDNVHIVLKAGIYAIFVDALFSGNLVYPASQISIFLFLGLASSQFYLKSIPNKKTQLLTKIILLLWLSLYMYILINYLLKDLVCWNCGSYADLMAPGFWFYGKAEHLIHYSLIP